MTGAQAELLQRWRRQVAEWREHLDQFENQGFKLLNGRNENISDSWIIALRGKVDDLQALIDKHDPDGLTAEP